MKNAVLERLQELGGDYDWFFVPSCLEYGTIGNADFGFTSIACKMLRKRPFRPELS